MKVLHACSSEETHTVGTGTIKRLIHRYLEHRNKRRVFRRGSRIPGGINLIYLCLNIRWYLPICDNVTQMCEPPSNFGILPKALKSITRQCCIPGRVLDVSMPEISLESPCVDSVVREFISAGMPKHVRVRLDLEPSRTRRPLDHSRESRRR
jgi:hypothetical protein